jgi:hypothetical protein
MHKMGKFRKAKAEASSEFKRSFPARAQATKEVRGNNARGAGKRIKAKR